MNSKWSETGILRKKQLKENFDDLLVFGYACKLFRDDEKALYIDQGKHLIPWMTDDNLKIDRYDGRGALSDLSSCEASREGYDTTRWLGLSESERKIEQMCDEYRYYYLYNNEEDENLYKEEESKRKKANEFQYSYDVPHDLHKNVEAVPTCEEEDKPFEPPKELNVPIDIEIPKTVKENARILKTAQFVSEQGPQMEILIKAKQANNTQFSFMNQHDRLYKYYRYLISAIKCGRFKVDKDEPSNVKENPSMEVKEEYNKEHYLHPSLAIQQQNASSMVTTGAVGSSSGSGSSGSSSTVAYKPKADCAYTQLVCRIKGNKTEQEASKGEDAVVDKDSEEYYKYYQTQYYEYYKQIVQQYANQAGCLPQVIIQNVQLQEQFQAQAAHFAQMACVHYQQQQQQQQQQKQKQQSSKTTATIEKPEKKKCSKAPLSLVHYSSDSDSNEDEEEMLVPNEEVALIIDKMASYVSKNGSDFERSVREKGDARFDFLREDHKYHAYYKSKVTDYKNKNRKIESKTIIATSKETKKPIVPVSFSIKKPKEETQKEMKSALPVEESDEDDDGPKEEQCKEVENSSESPPNETNKSSDSDDNVDEPPSEHLSKNNSSESTPKHTCTNVPELDPDDPLSEMIDLTDDNSDDKRIRKVLAEEKIKDKLALAAKDKLLQTKKSDRVSIQLERRKRAAMFLKMQQSSVDNRCKSRCGDTEKRPDDDEQQDKNERLGGGGGTDRHNKVIEEEIYVEDSTSEDEKHKLKRSKEKKRKKSYKRKSSLRENSSRHRSKSRHGKKSKKRRRRSESCSSTSSGIP